jgi:trimethylamine--corrinoid protein Co-methyltransferase
MYGGFTSNVDMQSGAPAFGTPEYVRTAMIGGQMARRYGCRTAAATRAQHPGRPGRLRGVFSCGARDAA